MSRQAAAKNIIVKLLVGAGQAAPTPPVGPALGSKGVKSIDFCREFNARTAHMEPGTPIPTRITIKPDRSFNFEVRTPPTSFLLLRAAGVEPIKGRYKGAQRPGHEVVGTVTMKHVYEIAKVKMTEERLQKMTLEGMCRTIVGHCKNMGVKVVN